MKIEVLNLCETHLEHINLDVLCTKMQMTFPKVIIMRSQADAVGVLHVFLLNMVSNFCDA